MLHGRLRTSMEIQTIVQQPGQANQSRAILQPLVPFANQLSYNTIPRNKQLQLDIPYHCEVPNKTLLVDWKGDCFICECESWLPISVGKITDFETLDHVWASPTALILQQDIADKKFSHCAVERCDITQGHIVRHIYTISVNIDESCNLRCPSCRRDAIMITSGTDYDVKLSQVNHLVSLLENFDHPCRIIMSGNGDPLASSILRPLIHKFVPGKDQQIKLFTNGLLIKKQIADSSIRDHIREYLISIDAGSNDVYEKVRLGGKWEQLLDNFDYLKDLVQTNKSTVALTFVVQRDNYLDMQNFCQLCIDYGFRGSITKLENWGTWDNYAEHDVIGNLNHNEHTASIGCLKNAYHQFKDRIWFATALIQAIQS